MGIVELRAELEAVVAPRRLLEHPFYLRWTRGEVRDAELRGYAAEYRHFEAALPGVLADIADRAVDDPRLRAAALRNLADEAGGPVTHLELFDRFASALGASPTETPGAGIGGVIAAVARQTAVSPATGLAALLAYEMQAPGISVSKAEGLRRHHALDDRAVAFWDLHGTLDDDHAEWLLEALAATETDAGVLAGAAREACDAWLGFLDEREAAAPAYAA